MAAEYLNNWSPAFKIAAHTALVDLLDADATDPAFVTIHSATDALLATVTLEKPSGVVNETTGAVTFAIDAREESAAAGVAAYATLRDGAGNAYHSMPCEAGTEPVAGKVVLNTLTFAAGSPVELSELVIE